MLVGTVDVIADGNLERRTLNPFSLQRDRHIACYPKECRFWEMVVDDPEVEMLRSISSD